MHGLTVCVVSPAFLFFPAGDSAGAGAGARYARFGRVLRHYIYDIVRFCSENLLKRDLTATFAAEKCRFSGSGGVANGNGQAQTIPHG